MKKVLTIAGSDCSGGAGIQADLKTMSANGVYGMSVITALTAQNTTGVFGILNVAPDFVASQLDSVFEDIMPDSVKIGMLSSKEIIDSIFERLKFYNAQNIVLDPVMVSTSGSKLIEDEAIETLKSYFKLATLITPNIYEAEILSEFRERHGRGISSKSDMLETAKFIFDNFGVKVLLKGGHSEIDADDLLYLGTEEHWYKGEKIDNPNTHGTGCTLSSAVASNLALGYNLVDSVANAKKYITKCIKSGLDLGKGRGPINHFA